MGACLLVGVGALVALKYARKSSPGQQPVIADLPTPLARRPTAETPPPDTPNAAEYVSRRTGTLAGDRGEAASGARSRDTLGTCRTS